MYAWGKRSASSATARPASKRHFYLPHFSDRLTLFEASGQSAVTNLDRQRLAEAGVRYLTEPIRSLRLWNRRVTVSCGGAETVCDSVYCALGMRVHSDLGVQLSAQ